eukprot:TRINITY_DN3323_c0_g3_i1.p1 TRINITY_DN3323_c0_g3~~TRINITY_DN3323_c0_g3_i1.p1  ORF type:complete len:742 (+),score=195.15 TRINITY_DN3323_c0_g3_i1:40-2226(+)
MPLVYCVENSYEHLKIKAVSLLRKKFSVDFTFFEPNNITKVVPNTYSNRVLINNVLFIDEELILDDLYSILIYVAPKSKAEDIINYQTWFNYDMTMILPVLRYVYAEKYGFADFAENLVEKAFNDLNKIVETLEKRLTIGKFISGNKPSPCDVVIYISLYCLLEEGILSESLINWGNTVGKMTRNAIPSKSLFIGGISTNVVVESHERRIYGLSEKPEKPFYVTTPIFYVNDAPHVGHVYSTMLADITARWFRDQRGFPVRFVTGTDEHGLKVQRAAESSNVDPQEHCNKYSTRFKETFGKFNLNYDRFIRTTDVDHHENVQNIWNKLLEKGLIYRGNFGGWYAVSDECFYTENDIEEVTDADGNTVRIAKESGAKCVWMEEENFMFRLSSFEKPLLEWFAANPNWIVPRYRQRDMIHFVENGLQDISVSRQKVSWGVPVPGVDGETIYVWIDALPNYLTAAGYGTDNSVWPADLHVLGKDILKFHSIIWPAILMALEVPLPKKLVAHGWWTKDGAKISKSTGNTFDINEMANKWGLDPLRYCLAYGATHGADGDFSERIMQSRLNSDLADAFGNLFCRAISSKLIDNCEIPTPGEYIQQERDIIAKINETVGMVDHWMYTVDTKNCLEEIWTIVRELNAYFQSQAPWKKSGERKDTIMYFLMECIRIITCLFSPVMPEKAQIVFNQLGCSEDQFKGGDHLRFGILPPGQKLLPEEDRVILFEKRKEF